MTHLLIFAGNKTQANECALQMCIAPGRWHYIHSPRAVLEYPWGSRPTVIFTGTWFDRKDCHEILETIRRVDGRRHDWTLET